VAIARLEIVGPRVLRRRDQDGGGAVDDAARVAGGMDVVDLLDLRVDLLRLLVERQLVALLHVLAELGERRLELAEGLERRLRARELLVIEHDRAVERAHGDDALREPAFLHRPLGVHLAGEGEAIAVVAGEALERRDEVGRDALRHERVQRAQVTVVAVDAGAVRTHRLARHALDTAADDELLLARHHAHEGEVHRLLAGAAETVQRDAGHLDRPARREHGHARDAATLLTRLRDAARDDVLDVRRVERIAGRERLQGLREELLRMLVGERSGVLLAAPTRGADGVDDPRVSHGSPFVAGY